MSTDRWVRSGRCTRRTIQLGPRRSFGSMLPYARYNRDFGYHVYEKMVYDATQRYSEFMQAVPDHTHVRNVKSTRQWFLLVLEEFFYIQHRIRQVTSIIDGNRYLRLFSQLTQDRQADAREFSQKIRERNRVVWDRITQMKHQSASRSPVNENCL